MFQLIERNGNLFIDCPQNMALAHCVSVDLKMSQGIAWQFRQRFGQLPYLKTQIKSVGECARLQHETRLVFYMSTKMRYYMKPSYHTLQRALIALKQYMLASGVQELAIPGYLACGRDKLNWSHVKQIICNVFVDTNIKMYVYYL